MKGTFEMLNTKTEALDNPIEGWVTLKEASRIVDRDISTVRYWVRIGKLACYRVGTSNIKIVNVEQVKAYSAQSIRLNSPKRGKKKKTN